MGRRTPGNAFSLFSFQDIITSITAILILIMLLLAVELTKKQQTTAAADPGVTRKKLERRADELESSATRLQDEVAAARESPGNRLTLEQCEQDLEKATTLLDEARLQRDDAAGVLQLAERVRVEAEAKLSARSEDKREVDAIKRRLAEDQAQADRLEKENATEKERQARRRQQIEERPRSGTQLVFNRPADSSRRPWLVELSDDGIAVVMLGANSRQLLGVPGAERGKVDAWVSQLQPVNDYCLLLVRPSADAALLEDLESRLDAASIQFGIDFIGENQEVRDGSAEAGGDGK